MRTDSKTLGFGPPHKLQKRGSNPDAFPSPPGSNWARGEANEKRTDFGGRVARRRDRVAVATTSPAGATMMPQAATRSPRLLAPRAGRRQPRRWARASKARVREVRQCWHGSLPRRERRWPVQPSGGPPTQVPKPAGPDRPAPVRLGCLCALTRDLHVGAFGHRSQIVV